MRSSCIFLLLAGLIVLVIESSESASLVQKNNELEEIKLLKELVESLKRAKDVREEDDGDGVGEDDGEDNNEDDGEDNGEDNGEENDDDDGEDNGEDNGEENDDDDGEDNGEENDDDDGEDIGEDNGEDGPEGEIETNPGDEPQVSPSDETEEGEGGTDDTDGGAEGGEQDTEIDEDGGEEEGDQGDQTTGDVTEDDEGEAGETPDQGAGETGTTTEGAAGPPDTNEERPNGPDREGISKDFADYLDSIGEQVLEKVDDILDALDANDLEEANAKVGLLLEHLEAMSEDANEFVNFLDTVRKHLHDGKNSLEDIANAFNAAEGIIRVGENRKPLDNEGGVESERQAKGEVGVPVARAVEGERQTKGEVGVPVARASVDGPIDKRAQLLREIRLLNLLKMLKDATKK